MPVDWSRYPGNWKAIVARIRDRSRDQCECSGECGLHAGKRCVEINKTKAQFANGKIVLTTAHLDHDTTNNKFDPDDCEAEGNNLKHMCQRCHLRYDNATKPSRKGKQWGKDQAGGWVEPRKTPEGMKQ